MAGRSNKFTKKTHRRTLGVHLTSTKIFFKYILPEIKDKLFDYIWIDQYAGEGALILPILKFIPKDKRINFFKNHIYLFDIQEDMVDKSINNALAYGIPKEIAIKNIRQRDNLRNFPKFLKKKELPIYHVSNPPYLYLGYIRKHEETKIHLKYFENDNDGYQDLYQIAMINDLRNGIENLIYIIPSNFIFGAAVSNKFRMDFFKYYSVIKMYIFETKIFQFTGTNICIGFFNRKKHPNIELIKFIGTKIKKNDVVFERKYELKPEFKYRGGSKFDDYIKHYILKKPLEVKYYLLRDEVETNKGNKIITAIDTSNYSSNQYLKLDLQIDDELYSRIKSNILYIRTVDTGSLKGKVGLYEIRKDFNVDGIYVSKNTYRTSPIHIFLTPEISSDDQLLLKDYFNFLLEYFRKKLDSEFLTTYKYSNAEYTRKYLGLTQVRNLIQTFPFIELNKVNKNNLKKIIEEKDFKEILKFLTKFSKRKEKKTIDLTEWL
ncbi:MAG: N-6 DNA methylase [Promethearchaeota archaeon]